MYVDASDLCNELTFQLGSTPMGTTTTERRWNIKVKLILAFSGELEILILLIIRLPNMTVTMII